MVRDSQQARRELGEFLRAHREGLSPESAGFLAGGRRRTPGLRREEVAQIAGLSVTWYVWIEQGREITVSVSALARLARALRLSAAERAYVFELAGKADPSSVVDGLSPLGGSLAASVDAIVWPAYVLDRYWNALAWNATAGRLFVGWLDADNDRNLLRYIFRSPQARTFVRDFAERAARVVAEFRIDYSRHLDDPRMRALVAELIRESPDFSAYWTHHAVLAREGGIRTFDHPEDGFLRFDQLGFALAGHPDVKLVMLAPVEAAAYSAAARP